METYVRCFDGRDYKLPPATKWEFSYGPGDPCDGFSVTCLWEIGSERAMADAVRFWAVHEGKRVFTGIVDEYRCVRDEKGSRLELSGRGLQGLLLDNEAIPMEYQTATLQDILRDHVLPYGIEVADAVEPEAAKGFAVVAGQSEWSVLRDFVQSRSLAVPRFDCAGRLWLTEWEDHTPLRIGGKTAVTKLIYGERRYGILSQIAVRDRETGHSYTVRNEDWIRRGGACRRVMTVNRETAADLRKTGEYQLRRSHGERVCCEVTVAGIFCAFPGQEVVIDRGDFGGNGNYRVAEAVTGMNENGGYTELILRDRDLLI